MMSWLFDANGQLDPFAFAFAAILFLILCAAFFDRVEKEP